MVCEPEAQNEIYQEAIGAKPTSVSKPTWIDHVYSCTYTYPGGASFTLSVRNLQTRIRPPRTSTWSVTGWAAARPR